MARLAEEAGVSKATVSLALRDHPRISSATRRRVQALAQKLGYRVAPAVSAWMAHRRCVQVAPQTERLAFINSWPNLEEWERSPWLTRYRDGAKARAEALGYGFDEFWLREPGMTPARLSKVLRTRGILGVLVGSLLNEQKEMRLDWSALAAVAQSHSLQRPALSRALSDYAFNTQMAISELRRMGYVRIGYAFAPKLEERTECLHLAAYLEDQFRLPSAQRLAPFDWTDKSSEKLARWLSRSRPDAVVSHDLELVNVIRTVGYRVPRDIGVGALNLPPTTSRNSSRRVRLAGVDQQLERCGAVAVDLLISHLHHHEMGPPVQPVIALTRGRWIRGDTLRMAR